MVYTIFGNFLTQNDCDPNDHNLEQKLSGGQAILRNVNLLQD